MNRKSLFSLIAAVMLFLLASPAGAESGLYMGIGAAYNTLRGGDFDGHHALVGITEEIILPDLNNAAGIALLLGNALNEHWALELNFMRSSHSGTWMGLNGDATFTSFSVNGKYRFLPARRVRPYLLFGFDFDTLVIKQGAADVYTGEVADAKLDGVGYNLGTGVDTYLHPKVSLTLGITYRLVKYTDVKGVHISGTMNDELNGGGFSVLLTTAYHF